MSRHVIVLFALVTTLTTHCGSGDGDGDDTTPSDDPICSDGVCDADETGENCPADCPPSCGDGTCGYDETQYSCATDCGSPEPNCGNCDDGNDCTTDRCEAGRCINDSVPDQVMGCNDATTLRRCDGGREREVPCGGACEYGGWNSYLTCDPIELTCWCMDTTGSSICNAANVDNEICVNRSDGSVDIADCRSPSRAGSDGYMWQIHDCDDLCVGAGYDYSTGCVTDSDDVSNRLCSCGVNCPPCGSGESCNGSTGQCESDDECDSDYDCGYGEACKYGQCVWVECTSDAHCYGCTRCSSNSCIYCGEGPYGCYC